MNALNDYIVLYCTSYKLYARETNYFRIITRALLKKMWKKDDVLLGNKIY